MSRQVPSPVRRSDKAPRGDTARELALLAIRRITSAPRLSAVLLVGALLAVGLASSAPIFIEAVRDLGLRQTLADADPAALDLRFVQTNVTADPESVDAVESLIANEVGLAVETVTVGRMTAMRTGGYILRTDDQPFNTPNAENGSFVAQSDLEEVSELVDGQLPSDTSDDLEVLVEDGTGSAVWLGGRGRVARPALLAWTTTRDSHSRRGTDHAVGRRASLGDA